MAAETTHQLVENIEQKAQLLVARLAQLTRDTAALTERNRELTEQNRTLQTRLLLSESEVSHLKTRQLQAAHSPEPSATNHQIRKEIDQYVTDIDECIDWLQKS